jgi:hypothetical protein
MSPITIGIDPYLFSRCMVKPQFVKGFVTFQTALLASLAPNQPTCPSEIRVNGKIF